MGSLEPRRVFNWKKKKSRFLWKGLHKQNIPFDFISKYCEVLETIKFIKHYKVYCCQLVWNKQTLVANGAGGIVIRTHISLVIWIRIQDVTWGFVRRGNLLGDQQPSVVGNVTFAWSRRRVPSWLNCQPVASAKCAGSKQKKSQIQ